ncbi:ubiquitin-conjugating enzyme/RWD-like protein [Catenaria anguillulae PL171]|uniref:Ubiquitin-conjugating enzyme/RWD-like protein n=1 Tax=Catenaria anguillulae PL171 TaxID=765915 RepID=A0A1Y2HKN9_9FUNG|nr:ubiquitin-conjugating enzyme/RWD-like protein [Catenaria anguillulae PL171]
MSSTTSPGSTGSASGGLAKDAALAAYFRHYALMAEFKSLADPTLCPRGMYLHPSSTYTDRWHGIYFPTSGPYFKAAFRFVVDFPATYPTSPPRVVFTSPPSGILHPLVAPGPLALFDPMTTTTTTTSTAKQVPGQLALLLDWNQAHSRAIHVLWAIKHAFTSQLFAAVADGSVPRSKCANAAAVDLWVRDRTAFLAKVDRVVMESVEEEGEVGGASGADPIVVVPMSEAKIEEIKARMFACANPSTNPSMPSVAGSATPTIASVRALGTSPRRQA